MDSEHKQSEAECMVTARSLDAATALLSRWELEREQRPLDRIVAGEMRSRHYLNSRERRWVTSAVYGTVRHLRRQEALLRRLGLAPTPDTLARLWICDRALPREAAAQTIDRSGLAPIAVAAEIEQALAELPGPEAPDEYLRTTLSFPDSMASELETLLGREATSAGEALNCQAPTTLRINPRRANRARVLAALPGSEPTRYSPWGVHLPHRSNLFDLPGYREGWFEAQEEASQLAALLTGAQPGRTVVEIGAGGGGKTLAMAALMHNLGRIIAIDASQGRLEELGRRAARAGITSVETVTLSLDEGSWRTPPDDAISHLEAVRGAAATVLVDAPCTGSGVLRRNPDAKWRTWDTAEVVRVQRLLLSQASAFVAPGGALIYVTCAFERQQNEAVVEAFLDSADGASFRLEPAAVRLRDAVDRAGALNPAGQADDVNIGRASADEIDELTTGPYLRTWPHRHGLDAFFAALLLRAN